MISIAANMDAYDVAQEIRLERQVHKGSFLLLEGLKDLNRFAKFSDESCSTVNCFGRENLIGAVVILYDEGFAGALGLADADFDRITDSLFVHEGVIYSETHDFDLDCACTDVLPRYLAEVAHTDKCETLGGAVGVRTFIFDALKPISVLRFVNHHQKLRYRLSRIRHHVVAPDTVVDIDVLVDNVSTGAFDSTGQKQTLKNLILAQAKCEFDARQLTNGHDFLTMLGVAL